HYIYHIYLITLRPPTSTTLFPYTTLFRSLFLNEIMLNQYHQGQKQSISRRSTWSLFASWHNSGTHTFPVLAHAVALALRIVGARSEEHTSELQSRENLVCRLLLEKKKNTK